MNFVAIGKQLQWGLTASAATGTQTLPISFSTTNYAIVVSQSDWDSNAEKYCARVKTRNKSSFSWFWGSVFQSGNGRLCFIVAGHQKQWGYTNGGDVNFNVSFNTAAYAAVKTQAKNSEGWERRITGLTLTGCKMGLSSEQYYWFAIGV